jgi:hypothetical protein
MNASLLGLLKKIGKNFLIFDLKAFFAKNRVLAHFRRRHMGVAANNFRRFREPKLQDIRHRYLWLKFQIFSLVNN